MSRKMILVGLTALCALALSAVATAGAQAAEQTAYTCVEGGTKSFSDSHCKTPQTGGKYGHVEIPAGTSTGLQLTAVSEPKLTAEVFGAELVLSAESISCEGCMAENVAGPPMKVVGSGGKLHYAGVQVANDPENCTVVSHPGGVPHVVETRALKFETDTTNSVTISPVTPPILATFEIVTAEGSTEECPFVGTHTVEGDVTATAEGATLNPVPNFGETLVLDEFFPAALQGEATITAGTTGGTYHPAALT
jgi:hypothetical protein